MLAFTFVLIILRELAFIASGMALCVMAFRLFATGITSGGAEEMTFGDYIKVRGGGPGIVFVCLGAVIIIYSISTAGHLEPSELEALIAFDTECVCDE